MVDITVWLGKAGGRIVRLGPRRKEPGSINSPEPSREKGCDQNRNHVKTGAKRVVDKHKVLFLLQMAFMRQVYLLLVALTVVSAFLTPKIASKSSMLHGKKKDMAPEEYEEAMDKATKAMTSFTNKYLKNTGTYLCSDASVPAVVIKGLAEHKVDLGAPLCPCRFYEDKEAEAKDGYWNCPCVPMRERHECHCMLFLTEDNSFVGDKQEIEFDDVIKLSSGMK